MTLIELLTNVSVKIYCNDQSDEECGSGTLISDGEKFFVMTAGHCIRKKSNNQPFAPDDIQLTSFAKDEPFNIRVIAVLPGHDFSEAKDCAVLEVENPQLKFDFSEGIKRCDTQLDEESYCFYGFTQSNEQGRLYCLRRTGKNQWHLVDDDITNQAINAYNLMAGNSGAGVFFVKSNILYHVGYVKRLIDESGTQSDIVVYPTRHFDGMLPATTKEENLFKLVEKWTEMKRKEIDDELMQQYQEENQEYLSNLSRKMHILYPHGNEAVKKERHYLGNYIRGLNLNLEISKTQAVATTLKERESDAFKDFCNERSEYVEDKDAREDLEKIQQQITDIADNVLGLRDQGKTVAKGYADYSIAEKLLDCRLDYKKESDD